MKKIIDNLPEITLIIGLFFIVLATFLINFIAGIYAIGIILSILGIFLAKKPFKNEKRR